MLYRIRDAAFRLGISVIALECAVERRSVRSVRITRDCIRITEEELERIIFEQIEIETNLDAKAVAKMLSVDVRTVHTLCCGGQLEAKKLKRCWVISAPALQKFIRDHEEI